MTLTIELTPAEESAIRAAAAREGMDISTFAREQMVRATHSNAPDRNDLANAPDRNDLAVFLRESGNNATRAARERLHEKGIGYIIVQSGAVVEKLPGGETNVLHAPRTATE